MRSILTLGSCFILLNILAACASVKSTDTEALKELHSVLQRNELNSQQIQFVNKNFEKVRTELISEAQAELETSSRFRWQNALTDYENLQKLNSLLNKHKSVFPGIESTDYSREIEEARTGYLDDLYDQAEEALSANNREGAKVAYFQLVEISDLVSDFREVEQLQAEALDMATVPVLISIDSARLPADGYQAFRKSFQTFVDTKGVSGPFIQFHFYDEWDDLSQVAHIASIRVDAIDQGKMIVKDYIQEVEEADEEYKIEEYSLNLNLVFSIEITETGLGRVLKNQEFELAHPFTKSVGRFAGDPALLNEYQKSIFATDVSAPTVSELFLEAVPSIRTELVNYLLEFYTGY